VARPKQTPKTKPIWEPQKFYVLYHRRREKWMVSDQCGHYIGLNGEILGKPKFHKNATIATEYLLMYQATPTGRANHEQILKYGKYEQALVMAEQAKKDQARKDKRK